MTTDLNLQTLVAQLRPIAEALPAAYRVNANSLLDKMGAVIEGIGDDGIEWKPPFLRLVQGTTDRSSIPRGTGIGDFVIGESAVERPLKFIPLRLWQGRQYWNPDQTKSNMLCYSPDAKVGSFGDDCRACPYARWEGEEKAACTKVYGILGLTADMSELFTANFAKSSYGAGMDLHKYMKQAGVDPYRRMYGLTSATSSTAKNIEVFKVEALSDKERNTDQAVLPFVRALFDYTGASRKALVEAFYLEVENKKQKGLFLPKPEVSTDTPALAAPVSESASPLAKSYSM